MPAGTTVKADITGTGFGLGTPSSYTVPCATEPTAAAFIVTTSNVAPGARGTLTVTVTTPGAAGQANSGVATVFVYSFTAT
jgi:hypothetical protein